LAASERSPPGSTAVDCSVEAELVFTKSADKGFHHLLAASERSPPGSTAVDCSVEAELVFTKSADKGFH
ncbi:hypothetical protein, partial [Escherichia coli]|uniref:hypothetical protein n=1 Tax=Escherichia coli TaxID=562 RepID=UPI00264FF3E7